MAAGLMVSGRPRGAKALQGGTVLRGLFDSIVENISACPWGGHAGLSPRGLQQAGLADVAPMQPKRRAAARPLYTPEERARRDASPWTLVQGVLAPLQFLICAVSLGLIARYLATGEGYALASGSVLLKTFVLYAIMITGSIWEKDVFGKWLFAPAFFWEDVVSMVVLALQTLYVVALVSGWGAPAQQFAIAVAAYAAYVINAAQFVLKLRAARRQASFDAGLAAHA